MIDNYPHSGYRAHDISDGTRVHLEINDDTRQQRVSQQRRAISIVAALSHPGIARIHGCGVLADRRPYVASHLADGAPLSDILGRRTLTIEDTLLLVRDLAEVVAYAHTRRVVHSAIRPHLVIMRSGEKPFPIQLGGWGDVCAGVDGRIDVYAIGAIAYHALTGKALRIITPDLVAGVPGAVGAFVVHMLDPKRKMTPFQVLGAVSKLVGDRVVGGPRFSRPRWTPAPPTEEAERALDIIEVASDHLDFT